MDGVERPRHSSVANRAGLLATPDMGGAMRITARVVTDCDAVIFGWWTGQPSEWLIAQVIQ